jgi:hypothetical protein
LTNIISLLIFTLSLAAGQLLFKQTALGIKGLSLAEIPVSLARMPSLYLALFLCPGWPWRRPIPGSPSV